MNEFDRIAPWYSMLERMAFGSALKRCRQAHLHHLKASRRILVIGDGTGHATHALLNQTQGCQTAIDVVDSSQRMLAIARKRIARAVGPEAADTKRVRWMHDDIEAFAPESAIYDAIVTQFVLDCFNEDALARLIPKVSMAAQPEAHWINADFAIPRQRVPRVRARVWLRTMYAFFRTTTGLQTRNLADPIPAFLNNGWTPTRQRQWQAGFLHSTLWTRSQKPLA